MLIVEGEPSDVYLACALENARGYVQATAVASDHHVRLVRPVKTLVSTIPIRKPSYRHDAIIHCLASHRKNNKEFLFNIILSHFCYSISVLLLIIIIIQSEI